MKITTGKKFRPQKALVYGVEGIGKTTLAADLPAPLFLDAEGGTDHLDLERVEVGSMADINGAINELAKGGHDYKTIVLDTIDWIEAKIATEIIERDGKKSIEEVGGGYGKGHTALEEQMMEFLLTLSSKLIRNGMSVVLLGHCKVVKFDPPEAAGSYDRYEPKLSKKGNKLVKEWADAVLFFNYETHVVDRDRGNDSKKVAKGGQKRVLYSEHHAAYDAKNRHNLPSKIPVPKESPASGIRFIFEVKGEPEKVVEQPPAEPAATSEQPEGGGSLSDLLPIINEAGGPSAVNAFLAHRERIKPGETWEDLPQGFIDRIKGNRKAFVGNVKAFTEKGVEA